MLKLKQGVVFTWLAKRLAASVFWLGVKTGPVKVVRMLEMAKNGREVGKSARLRRRSASQRDKLILPGRGQRQHWRREKQSHRRDPLGTHVQRGERLTGK